MTGSLRLWLWTKFLKQTQPNPPIAHRAGHTIMTTLKATVRFAITHSRTDGRRLTANPANGGGGDPVPHATLNQGRRFNSTSFVRSRSAAAFQSETRMNH